MDKIELRKALKRERAKLAYNEIVQYSTMIHNSLYATKEYQQSDLILAYVSFSSEVGTHLLIEKALKDGKKVAVPKVFDKETMKFIYISSLKDLKPGAYDILEPTTSVTADSDISSNTLILLPGIGFDLKFNRLGYGGGYYDRYLAKHPNLKKIMLAYELEKVDLLPTNEYDIKSDIIITEQNIYKKE